MKYPELAERKLLRQSCSIYNVGLVGVKQRSIEMLENLQAICR